MLLPSLLWQLQVKTFDNKVTLRKNNIVIFRMKLSVYLILIKHFYLSIGIEVHIRNLRSILVDRLRLVV